MGAIVGIDLGTTFSAVAHLDETGRAAIVHNKDGGNTTPSVVEFTDAENASVGEEARQFMCDPNFSGAARFKRHMDGSKTYEIKGKSYSPTEMSAFVLRKLKDDTEAQLGPIEAAVITTPANFSNVERDATLAAAKSVGLNVLTLVNEPEAAALFYALDTKNLGGTYAAYDLGGGTFDFSVVRINGFDIEVLGSNGVKRLGGDDFDAKLLELVQARYKEQTGSVLGEGLFYQNDAEKLKINLSKRESRQIIVNGESITITRTEFEELISGLLAQSKLACEGLMSELNLEFSELSGIFLVGGSTRMPAVQNLVKQMLGKDALSTANPDEVVARGAAFYAAHKSPAHNLTPLQKAKIEPVEYQAVSHQFYGTITLGQDNKDQNSILIKKGQKIPCSFTDTFYTVSEGQTGLQIRITETSIDEKDPTYATILKEGRLELPPGRPAGQEVEVTFEIESSGILRGHFKDVESGRDTTIIVNLTDPGGAQPADPTKVFTVE
ncbi:Hsp70 family protein [Arenicellales bacterium IMCC57338]